MFVKLWPSNYINNELINHAERYLMRVAEKKLTSGHFVVGLDPVGLSTEQMHFGMYISPKEGLLTFTVVQGKIDESKIGDYIMMNSMFELAIYKRLLDSNALIVRNEEKKVLKFPYKHVFIFPEEEVPVKSCRRSELYKLADIATVRFFVPVMSNTKPGTIKELRLFENVHYPFYSRAARLTQEECLAIFERLAPEYTIALGDNASVKAKEVNEPLPVESGAITGKEVGYKTFFLDDYQLSMINDSSHGHRVLLANAGAGKSVFLLSKAIRCASLYKNKSVLLTCYNNNLADFYRTKLDCAGLANDPHRRLFALTFHKLVEKLFDVNLHKKIDRYATDEQIQACISLVKSGRIKTRFHAILIDEVQIFTPLYLELCYTLLEKPSEGLFLMAGDLNQTVRAQSRRGDAPWKKIDGGKLDFTGRVKYVRRNYRNSPEISQFLNRLLIYMNSYLNRFNMININEFEYDIMSNGNSRNVALCVNNGIDRQQIQLKTINAIQEIAGKYQIPYSEIAVLFPMREHRALNYHIQYWIRDALQDANIPFSLISTTENPSERSSYSNTNGVILSSIDSSLGLDFRAVVLTGLYPYSYIFDSEGRRKKLKGWDSVLSLSTDEKEEVKIYMRKIYTACSRAREVLYVLSDAESGTIIDSIIRSGKGKSQ